MSKLTDPNEIAKATGAHPEKIPTSGTVTIDGRNSSEETGIYSEVSMFISITGSGGLFKGANSLSQEKKNVGGNPELYGFKFMLDSIATVLFGLPFIRVPRTKTRLYIQILSLLLKKEQGKLTQGEKVLLTKYVEEGIYFQPQAAKDFQAYKEFVEERKKSISAKKSKKDMQELDDEVEKANATLLKHISTVANNPESNEAEMDSIDEAFHIDNEENVENNNMQPTENLDYVRQVFFASYNYETDQREDGMYPPGGASTYFIQQGTNDAKRRRLLESSSSASFVSSNDDNGDGVIPMDIEKDVMPEAPLDDDAEAMAIYDELEDSSEMDSSELENAPMDEAMEVSQAEAEREDRGLAPKVGTKRLLSSGDVGAGFELPEATEGSAREKISMTCTVIPREGGNPRKHQDVVGYIYRFLVRDPEIASSLGDMVWKLISEVKARIKHRSGKSERFYRDPRPQYMSCYGGDFPALNLTRERWVKNKISYVGEKGKMRNAKSALQLESSFNVTASASPLEPCNVYTIERALEYAKDAGADTDVCHLAEWTTEQVSDREGQRDQPYIASFPDEKDAITYKYSTCQLFWYSKEYIGLSEQYFPNLSCESQFIEDLKRNANMEKYFKKKATNSMDIDDNNDDEEDDNGDPKSKSSFDLMLRHEKLIRRSEVKAHRLLNYETANQFMHAAAEYDEIKNKIKAYFPSDPWSLYQRTRYYVELAIVMNADIQEKAKRDKVEPKFVNFKSLLPQTSEEEVMKKPVVRQLIQQHGKFEWREHLDKVAGLNKEEKRELIDCDLREKVERYERFGIILSRSDEHCMKRFLSLFQIDGDIDSLPISDPVKANLKYYRDVLSKKYPNLTKGFELHDPSLGIFGNSQLFMITIYRKVCKIVQVLICLLCEGLWSCYEYHRAELKWNMLLHGEHDGGKTFSGITTLCNNSIPGTVTEQTSETAAAGNTQKHRYDEVLASDEAEIWAVNAEEGKKQPERVNTEKVLRTRLQVTKECFEFTELPDGSKVRWTRRYVTDHYTTRIKVTNEVADKKGNALSSREFQMMVTKNDIPVNELQHSVPAQLKGECRDWLRINQFFLCGISKGEMCGAIREPFMGMFMDYSNRVIQVLRREKYLDESKQARPLELMLPYARQLVKRTAVHLAFDCPAGPCYKQPFSVENLKKVEPYLYADEEHVWWTFTACGPLWIENDKHNVLRALSKMARMKIDEEETCIEAVERCGTNAVGVREVKNDTWSEGMDDEDRYLVDPNYQTICNLSFNQLCSALEKLTFPKISAEEVKAALEGLAEENIVPRGGTLARVPKGFLNKWFVYQELKDPNNPQQPGQRFKTEGEMPTKIIRQYRINRNPDTRNGNWLKTSDLPLRGDNISIPIVDLRDIHQNKVHFIPSASMRFKQRIIKDALLEAGIRPSIMGHCNDMRKFLLGTPFERDPSIFMVQPLDKENVLLSVQDIQEAQGWVVDENDDTGDKLVYVGDIEDESLRPIPLSKGLTFNRRGALDKAETSILTGTKIAPCGNDDDEGEGRDSWKDRYEESVVQLSKKVEVIQDVDEYSAVMQHMRCGLPLDAPVQTRIYSIKENKAAWARLGQREHGGVDYPLESIQALEKHSMIWKDRTTKKQRKTRHRMFGRFDDLARSRYGDSMVGKKRNRAAGVMGNSHRAAPRQQRRRTAPMQLNAGEAPILSNQELNNL